MEIIRLGNRENLKSSHRWYAGKGGKKFGIIFNDKKYIVKLPGNIKNRKENIEIPYNNSPISEYIGSHIYNTLNIDSHNTLLASLVESNIEKIVVLCEDFLNDYERLITFNELKISAFENDVFDELTNGTGCHLSSILKVIRNDPFVSSIKDIEKRFWQMFVVDYFIGNPDRHSGNWGIIIDNLDNVRLAPVYDNGNCLYNLGSDNQLKSLLVAKDYDIEFNNLRSSFLDDNNHALNVYSYLKQSNEKMLNEVIKEIVSKIDLDLISKIIEDIPIISDIRKEFYIKTLMERYKNGLTKLALN